MNIKKKSESVSSSPTYVCLYQLSSQTNKCNPDKYRKLGKHKKGESAVTKQ